jgi:hypothetical protein
MMMVGLAARADGEEADRFIAAVDELMRALPAPREGKDITGREFVPAVRRSHAGAALEHDQDLLLGEVVVVRVCRLPGRNLEQAEAQPLASGLAPEARPQAAEPRVLTPFVELGVVDAQHARSLPPDPIEALRSVARACRQGESVLAQSVEEPASSSTLPGTET